MLSNCEIAVEKSQQMLLINQNEMNNYLKLYHKIESGIIEAENELILCKQRLKRSEFAQNNADYKLETMRNLVKLETEIGNLNSIKDDLSFKLAKRQKQCNDLLNTAQFLQAMFAKEEHQLAIEHHVKNKQRSMIKQQLINHGFMKHEFNNVLAMDSIVAIQSQASCNNQSSINSSITNTTILPEFNQIQHSIASTTPNTSFFGRFTNQSISTSILQRDCSDSNSEMLSTIKMPKIFLRDVTGRKFISKTVKNFGKESNNKINIKLNRLHLINNPVLQLTNNNQYKIFDMDSNANTITCR